MINYNNHYKERSPFETIQLIKNFFEKRGYNINVGGLKPNEIGTWSCYLHLYLNNYDNMIMSSNGKGMTEEFALASGYAELFERFCNQIYTLNNPFLSENIFNYNKQKYNYFLDEKEKILSYQEIMNEDKIKRYILAQTGTLENAEKLLTTLFNNNFIGLPFKNINNETIKYLDPRVLLKINGSSGMAAGNSLEESINQGLSESFEHYVTHRFFKEKLVKYPIININDITDLTLKEKIANIESFGNKVYIIDLSYEYNMPVLMSLVISNKSNTFLFDFGAFPVFEIALERTITELYQNIYTLDDFKIDLPRPFQSQPWTKTVCENFACITLSQYFPEDIFDRMVEMPFNEKIFLSQKETNYSNLDIFYYYQKLCNSYNYNVYYYNYSLCNDLYAIKIYIDNIDEYISQKELFEIGISELDKTIIINLIIWFHSIINNFIHKKYFNFNEFKKIIFNINKYYTNFEHAILIRKYLFTSWLSIADDQNLIELISEILFNPNLDFHILANQLFETTTYKYIKKYGMLYEYVKSNLYTEYQLLNLFNNIFNENITSQDINNILNREYLIYKIILEPFYNDYHSENYQRLIKSFCK